MKVFRQIGIGYIATFFVITLLIVFWFFYFQDSAQFATIVSWSQSNILTLYFIILLIKTLGIIWPPLPGGYFAMAAIPIYGWPIAFSLDFLGGIIGAALAYFIGQHWGKPIINRLFSADLADKIDTIKIHPGREIEAIVFFRITAIGLAEFVCYAAGILNINFSRYILGTAIAHIVFGIPLFFFADQLFVQENFLYSIPFSLLGALLIFRFRKRYIIRHKSEIPVIP